MLASGKRPPLDRADRRDSGGAQGGPETSPRRREAGRREQAERDNEKRGAVASSPDGLERRAQTRPVRRLAVCARSRREAGRREQAQRDNFTFARTRSGLRAAPGFLMAMEETSTPPAAGAVSPPRRQRPGRKSRPGRAGCWKALRVEKPRRVYPQGVRRIRKAAKSPTAAQPRPQARKNGNLFSPATQGELPRRGKRGPPGGCASEKTLLRPQVWDLSA